MKKIITFLLILVIVISQFSVNVFANANDENTLDEDEFEETVEYLETLDVNELNEYISEIKNELENSEIQNHIL